MKNEKCKVENCEETAHAKGYCRKHYARMWRAKESGNDDPSDPRPVKLKKAVCERTRALKYELDSAKSMYESVIGVSSRLKWKKRIRWLETELKSLESGLDDL